MPLGRRWRRRRPGWGLAAVSAGLARWWAPDLNFLPRAPELFLTILNDGRRCLAALIFNKLFASDLIMPRRAVFMFYKHK